MPHRYGSAFNAAEYEAALSCDEKEDPPELGVDPQLQDVNGPRVLQHLVVERQQWRSHGFVVIDGVFEHGLVAAAAGALEAEHAHDVNSSANGTETWIPHPFDSAAKSTLLLREISMSPRIFAVAAGLLGTTELELARAELRIRHGGTADDHEEPLHQDYLTQSLTVPPRSPLSQECVCVILYLTVRHDSAICFIECTFSPHRRRACIDMQTDSYGLVEGGHEVRYWDALDDVAPIKLPSYKIGTCVLYRMDVFHRALPVEGGRTQFSMHLTIKRKAVTWVGASDLRVSSGACSSGVPPVGAKL